MSNEQLHPAVDAAPLAPARKAENRYLQVGKNLVEIDGVQLGIAQNVQATASPPYVGQLLLETTEKIGTVASLVGFHDASHLSRQFLKHSGRRPGDYRRTWWDDPAPSPSASPGADVQAVR